MPPSALDRILVCPSKHINETDRMAGGIVSTHQDTMLVGMRATSFRNWMPK